LCSGHDDSVIVDDEGGLQKTLSVENSMKRGTIRTKEHVLTIMEDLYQRLPLLLKDRADWSPYPTKAYPTVIRLTARTGVATPGEGRRFITRSQQKTFDGRMLCQWNALESASWLRQNVAPLLDSLLFTSVMELNVTRLNLAVSNFQDLLVTGTSISKHVFSPASHKRCPINDISPSHKRFQPMKSLAEPSVCSREHPELA
jgi:impB/mucB/samB family C-terminal domain